MQPALPQRLAAKHLPLGSQQRSLGLQKHIFSLVSASSPQGADWKVADVNTAGMNTGKSAQVLGGQLVTYDSFPSEIAAARRVDVWLPPSYFASNTDAAKQSQQQQQQQQAEGEQQQFGEDNSQGHVQQQQLQCRHPVLYMHDGQNLFEGSASFTGVTWGLEEAVQKLVDEGSVAVAPIIVGIWNTEDRMREYMPAGALRWLMERQACWHDMVEPCHYNPTSDLYLQMVVEELKPFIDATYRTLPQQPHTAMMGSSMGALLSLYALQRHPDVFGAAACLSTHWLPAQGACLGYLRDHPPNPAMQRVYFDRGTAGGLEQAYDLRQKEADRIMLEAGFVEGSSYESHVFEGAKHNEASWRARVHMPLKFLFGH